MTEIEDAVNKVGAVIAGLIKTVEKHGGSVSEDELNKAFAFLNETLTATHLQAQIARKVASAVGKSFSFDSFQPAKQQLPAPGIMPRDNGLGGRLVGQRKSQPVEDVDFIDIDEDN